MKKTLFYVAAALISFACASPEKMAKMAENVKAECTPAVLEVVAAFEKACGRKIPYAIKPRRPGDIAVCYCDPGKAKKELGWEAQYGIDEMCADSWRWQRMNPDGYRTGDADNA